MASLPSYLCLAARLHGILGREQQQLACSVYARAGSGHSDHPPQSHSILSAAPLGAVYIEELNLEIEIPVMR